MRRGSPTETLRGHRIVWGGLSDDLIAAELFNFRDVVAELAEDWFCVLSQSWNGIEPRRAFGEP